MKDFIIRNIHQDYLEHLSFLYNTKGIYINLWIFVSDINYLENIFQIIYNFRSFELQLCVIFDSDI